LPVASAPDCRLKRREVAHEGIFLLHLFPGPLVGLYPTRPIHPSAGLGQSAVYLLEYGRRTRADLRAELVRRPVLIEIPSSRKDRRRRLGWRRVRRIIPVSRPTAVDLVGETVPLDDQRRNAGELDAGHELNVHPTVRDHDVRVSEIQRAVLAYPGEDVQVLQHGPALQLYIEHADAGSVVIWLAELQRHCAGAIRRRQMISGEIV